MDETDDVEVTNVNLSEAKQDLVDELLSNMRQQYVDFGTCIDQRSGKNNVLDVVLGCNHLNISCEPTKTRPSKADHQWITIDIKVQPEDPDREEQRTQKITRKPTIKEWYQTYSKRTGSQKKIPP